MITPGHIIQLSKLIKSILVPSFKNGQDDYEKGWNDCAKQIRRNYTHIIKPWLDTLEKGI